MRNTTRTAIGWAAGLVLALGPVSFAAGNVTVEVKGRNLLIRGDTDSNNVVVVQGASPDDFEFIGTGGTMLNGANDPVTLPVPRGWLDVRLEGGDDTFDISHGSGRFEVGSVRVDLGPGDNGVEVFSQGGVVALRRLLIRGQSGQDAIFLGELEAGTISISTDGGNDVLWMLNSESTKTLKIDTSDGDDEIRLEDLKLGGKVKIDVGAGSDDLTILNAQFEKPVSVKGDGGTSRFDFDVATFVKKVRIKQNVGTLFLTSDQDGYAKGLAIKSGDANDNVFFDACSFGGPVVISTRDGFDDVRFGDGSTLAKGLKVVTGDGEDRMELLTCTLSASVKLLGGADIDTFELAGNVFAKRLLMNGGPGDDEQFDDTTTQNTFNGPPPKIVSVENVVFP